MQGLSAADAITPAIYRTRNYLFRPFELGTYLKLCLVAVITEGLGGNFNSIPWRAAGGLTVTPHRTRFRVHRTCIRVRRCIISRRK